MEILSEKGLRDRIRSLGDKVQKRLWIASPYLGSYEAIRRIVGRKWLEDNHVDVHLLTDIDSGSLNPRTLKCFNDKGTIKTIQGLHAKIYIIDDKAIVTSANLTGTAFSKRYEVGVMLTKVEAKPLIKLFSKWWGSIADDIPPDWTPPKKGKKGQPKEEPGNELPNLWSLLSDPGDPNRKLVGVARNYEMFLRSYAEFAQLYKNIQRIWPNRPLFFETDSFLNFLFHHGRAPSEKYQFKPARQLTETQRKRQIRKYSKLYKKWILAGSEGVEKKDWRGNSSRTIQKILSKKNVLKINKKGMKEVANNLNCLNAVSICKSRFLLYNKPGEVRKAWNELLYDERTPLQIRISECMEKLFSFKESSIGELLGFFNPKKYPLRNDNSISGLRFFGYDVPFN